MNGIKNQKTGKSENFIVGRDKIKFICLFIDETGEINISKE